MNEVLKNIEARHSVRAYTQRQLSVEALDQILRAAVCAPNGMHLQTWHFTAIQNPRVLCELNNRVKAVFARSSDAKLRARGLNADYCCYYHAPTLVIASNEPAQWWAAMDCACALENIFLAARSLGIGSCWINQVGQTCDEAEVRDYLTELGIPASHKVYGCAALGYEPEDAPVKERKLKDYTVTIIH